MSEELNKNTWQPDPSVEQSEATPIENGGDINKNKTWAILSYFWILSVYVLLTKKDSPFAHYHAKQGVVLFITSTVVSVSGVFFGFAIFYLLHLVNIALFVLFVIGISNASSGKQKPLPIIGTIAENWDI